MKTNRLINALFVLLLMLPLLTVTSCSEEDAPTYAHSSDDLISGDAGPNWTWTTVQGEDLFGEFFVVTIDKISDSQFVINNFGGAGDAITVNMAGTSLTFSGDLVNGAKIEGGVGSITNGWATMELSFTYNGEENQDCKVTLQHEKALSKKAQIVKSAK